MLISDVLGRVRPTGGQLTTTYQVYLSIGTALIILFAVVAPASYFLILFRLRKHLQVSSRYHDCTMTVS